MHTLRHFVTHSLFSSTFRANVTGEECSFQSHCSGFAKCHEPSWHCTSTRLHTALLISLRLSFTFQREMRTAIKRDYRGHPRDTTQLCTTREYSMGLIHSPRLFCCHYRSEASEDLKIENEENMKAVVAGAKSHGVSISLTVGGWTGSKYFSKLVTDEDSRKRLHRLSRRRLISTASMELILIGNTQTCLEMMAIFSPPMTPQLLAIPQDSARGFRTQGPDLGCGLCSWVHGPDGSYLIDHKPYAEVLDFITIMAYDLYSPSSTDLAGPNAPLFETCNDPTVKVSVAKAIQTWTSTGFPASKILLGLPATGTTAGPTTCGGEEEGHTWLFKDLVNCVLITPDGSQGLKGYTRYYDHCSRTPFLFESSSKT
ncbi:hypothetical protein H4Q26_001644 [Puccinia striiformis f. sp. tritici PST-130]|nr:hypothetical protein H4Q26_001644 [Puccinia striiformis f. sp. tritici PST-130]